MLATPRRLRCSVCCRIPLICTGLIYYLPPPAVAALFGSLARAAAPGSQVMFDYLHQEDLEGSCPRAKPAYAVTARR